MTRDEHLQWCETRAMDYVAQGDLINAVASMMSDMQKHDGTATSENGALARFGVIAALKAAQGDRDFVVRYIEGFR